MLTYPLPITARLQPSPRRESGQLPLVGLGRDGWSTVAPEEMILVIRATRQAIVFVNAVGTPAKAPQDAAGFRLVTSKHKPCGPDPLIGK